MLSELDEPEDSPPDGLLGALWPSCEEAEEASDKVDSSTPTSGGSDSEAAALELAGGTEDDDGMLIWLEAEGWLPVEEMASWPEETFSSSPSESFPEKPASPPPDDWELTKDSASLSSSGRLSSRPGAGTSP